MSSEEAYNYERAPKEGTVREVNGKKFVWTTRGEGTCFISEWVEQKPPQYNYDGTEIYGD